VLPTTALRNLYYSLIHSHLLQGITIWGNTYDKYVKRLIMLQNKAVKIVAGGRWCDHATPYYRQLQILTLKDLYVHEFAKLMNQYMQKSIAVLEQLPYSPDLAPCDFFLFLKLKKLIFKTQKLLKQPWQERFEQSWRNPSRSAWKCGRGDWKSASKPKEITLKATCCKNYLTNKIKRL